MQIDPTTIINEVTGKDPVIVGVVLFSFLASLWIHGKTIKFILRNFFENIHIISKIVPLLIAAYAVYSANGNGIGFIVPYVFGAVVIAGTLLAIHKQAENIRQSN